MAASLDEIKERARDKFEKEELPRILIDHDGTEIDEDEYFQTLEAGTELIAVFPGEEWADVRGYFQTLNKVGVAFLLTSGRLPIPAHAVRDHHDETRLCGRDGQCRVREDSPAEARGPAAEQPVLGVGAERGRPGDAVQHGPQLGGRHHRQGLYRAAEGDLRQVSGGGEAPLSSPSPWWWMWLLMVYQLLTYILFHLSVHRILFEKRQANDAIELLRVLNEHRRRTSAEGDDNDPLRPDLGQDKELLLSGTSTAPL